jgi:hypothetical protein
VEALSPAEQKQLSAEVAEASRLPAESILFEGVDEEAASSLLSSLVSVQGK